MFLSRVEDEEVRFKHLMARIQVFLASDADFCRCKHMDSWRQCLDVSPSSADSRDIRQFVLAEFEVQLAR